jgi:hypothetical protein
MRTKYVVIAYWKGLLPLQICNITRCIQWMLNGSWYIKFTVISNSKAYWRNALRFLKSTRPIKLDLVTAYLSTIDTSPQVVKISSIIIFLFAGGDFQPIGYQYSIIAPTQIPSILLAISMPFSSEQWYISTCVWVAFLTIKVSSAS